MTAPDQTREPGGYSPTTEWPHRELSDAALALMAIPYDEAESIRRIAVACARDTDEMRSRLLGVLASRSRT